MQRYSLRNISKVGYQPGPRTRILNMRSPISAISAELRNACWEMTIRMHQHPLDLVNQAQLPNPHQSNVHYWAAPLLKLHPLLINLAFLPSYRPNHIQLLAG